MDDEKPRSPTVQQIIDDANSKAIAAEINRTFASIAGRPAPAPETIIQPRPPRRKSKGSSR